MSESKLKIRFFSIADFAEEEVWLREEHKAGWKLVKMTQPCFYRFEKCEPEDVIYRLDFTNGAEKPDYMQMMADYGWEYSGRCVGWLYFRKPASEVLDESDGELFSDNASRIEMIRKVMKRRMLPLTIIFFCCVLPNAARAMDNELGTFFTAFWSVMLLAYIYLMLHCSLKLRRLQKELE